MKVQKLTSSNLNNISTVFHLSDIHIRLDRRHDEYRLVFDKLYNYLRSQNCDNSVIFIGGDILHSKCELSPEEIDLCISFFTNLGNIADVILIIGNHDTNLNNNRCLDSLSPLVNTLGCTKKFHYLINSGFYEYKNIILGVSSLWDGKFIKMNDIDQTYDLTNKIKVALYHGIVNDAYSDMYFKLTSNIHTNCFENYDYAFLGDIHKRQVLNNNIFYPSSLIQQNYAESLTEHGLYKHDLVNKISDFIPIQNDYGFITLDIKDGKITNENIIVPTYPRIKMKLQNTTKAQYKAICDDFKSKYVVQEITFVNIYDTIAKTQTKQEDYYNLESQNTMISNYIKNNLDPQLLEKILNFNKVINSEVKTKSETVRNKWKIKVLQFSNMFCYGPDNVIFFDSLEGINGLMAPNYSGKSSILDIILFSLFDKCSRGTRTDVLNEKKTRFSCQIEFLIGNTEYLIKREGVKAKNGVVKITVEFWKMTSELDENGENMYVSLNGKDRLETNKKICDLIGNYEDYIMTSFCLQKEISFIDYPQAKKKDFLMHLLGLNIFDEMLHIAKDKHKENRILYTKLFSEFKLINKNKLIENLEEKTKEKKLLEKQNEKLISEISNLRSIVEELYKNITYIKEIDVDLQELDDINIDLNINKKSVSLKILKLSGNIDELDNLQKINFEKIEEENTLFESNRKNKIIFLQNELKSLYENRINTKIPELSIHVCENKISQLDQNIDDSQKIINNNNNKIKELNVENQDQLLKNLVILKEHKQLIITKQNELDKISNIIHIMNEKIDKLKNYKYNPDCYVCKNNEFVTDANNAKLELPNYINNKNVIQEEIEILNQKIEAFGNLEEKISNLKLIDEMTRQNNLLEKEIDIFLKDRNMYNSILEEHKNVKLNEEINIKIKNTEELITSTNNLVNTEYENVINLRKKLNTLKDNMILLEQEKNKLQSINSKISDNNMLISKHKEYLEISHRNTKLENNIDNNKKIIKQNTDLVSKNINLINDLTKNITDLEFKIENYNSLVKQIESYEKEHVMMSNYIKIIDKDGLPYTLLNNIIPKIQNKINSILENLVDFSIHIELKDSDIIIYKNTNNTSLDIEMGSGFEKFIVGLSLRIAITQLSNISACNFLVIDEGFACADNNHINSLDTLFEYLKEHFDFVILISHLQALKGKCDNILDIKIKNGFSSIVYN